MNIKRAAARTVGTHFAAITDDHECKATCYRVSSDHVSTLCDAGHIVSMRMLNDSNLGGSRFAADLNKLAVGAPFVICA